MTVHGHPSLVLGGGRPGRGEAGAGHLYGDHSGGQVGAGRSLQRPLHTPCRRQFLTGEDELSRHLPVSLTAPLSAQLGNFLRRSEADVADTLELLSLLDEAPGAHLPLLAPQQVVRAVAGHERVVRPLWSLYLDLNLFGLLGNVQTGMIFLLLSQHGRVPLLSVLLDAV